jgi:hypothetical protein
MASELISKKKNISRISHRNQPLMSQTPVANPSKAFASSQTVKVPPRAAEFCEIELSTAMGDVVDEEIDTEPRSLLSPGEGRSDDTQVPDAEAESAPWYDKNNTAIDIPDFSSSRTRPTAGARLSTRHRSQYSKFWDSTRPALLPATLVLVIILVLTLSLALPSLTPKGHNGDMVIQGGCNDRTRCDKSALCVTLSPSTYTCSCPSWLIGTGFDDDPCICQQIVLSVPDFSRNVCVTKGSHFTLAGLVSFIVGMTILFVFGCVGAMAGLPHVLGLCILLVLLASAGMMTPHPSSICGQSSFGAQVCETGTNCVDGACTTCAQGQHWDQRDGTCHAGASGRCTPNSCNNVPNSTCVEEYGRSDWSKWSFACATNSSTGRPPSSSAIASAPALTLTLMMAMMLLV